MHAPNETPRAAPRARPLAPLPRPWARNPFARPRAPSEPVAGVTLLGTERVNFYAVTEGRAVTLIDCGFFGHLRYLEAWLAATGRRAADVEAVVVTHGHADHLGFAAVFAARGVPVYVPDGDLAQARTTGVRRPPPRLLGRIWRPSCLGLFAEAVADSVFSQPAVEGAVGYADGATLDVPGALRAVHVPGHSAGHCCLLLPGVDAVFTGDALMTRDPMGTATGPLVFAEHPRANGRALASLGRLAGLEHASMLPAHGEPWAFPGALGRAVREARIV